MTQSQNHISATVSSAAALVILGGLSWLLFLMLKGYISTLLVVLILFLVFNPVYRWLSSLLGKKRRLAAILTLIFAILAIIGPIALLVSVLVREAVNVINSLESATFRQVFDRLSEIASRFGLNLAIDPSKIQGMLTSGFGNVSARTISLFGSALKGVTNAFILLLGLYYMFLNSQHLQKSVIRYSPLGEDITNRFLKRAEVVLKASLRGNGIILLAQGAAGGLGMYIFGVGSPFLLGAVYGFTGLIPGIGTGLVWIPAVIYLLLQGKTLAALGLLIWVIVFVGLIDNFLSPFLIEGRANLHPFLVLLGVLGGLSAFGLLGLIIGPTVVALTSVALEVYGDRFLRSSA